MSFFRTDSSWTMTCPAIAPPPLPPGHPLHSWPVFRQPKQRVGSREFGSSLGVVCCVNKACKWIDVLIDIFAAHLQRSGLHAFCHSWQGQEGRGESHILETWAEPTIHPSYDDAIIYLFCVAVVCERGLNHYQKTKTDTFLNCWRVNICPAFNGGTCDAGARRCFGPCREGVINMCCHTKVKSVSLEAVEWRLR